ncbi:MAG: leucine--tRNA ligase [Armatimonadota bacterium]|nr:leucine--tRNA ligase [Armatimonadota bacterium]MDR7450470.1 leucine--tRNA ligase [Armatimonadota bacterium]MDR7466947.1 leucine--tRNA ligase [Armatimonadota bacterium]MDR7493511.1 leucine--tRNA ligase [Armatimonadota bacterium]MDR7498776.1 leucine--tRNA ligase [Armatimonadota bacterium]
MRYDATAIEAKWQARWEADRLYHAPDFDPRPKWYFLTMYPYPSGDLHIGHWYAMAPSDAAARFRRMQGYNVMFPIGFDAFGLPAENAAIQHGIHPYTWTMENIQRMRRQLRSMGAMWDWDREIVTCDPEYYKWNQWFFLRMYERGLAYRALAPVDWCPRDNTTLAREQVVGEERVCERCGTPVVKKNLEQWFLRITAYAEELLNFSGIEWPERVRVLQENWIGRSPGVEFELKVAGHPDAGFRVFTTRPDTVYGMTFAVLAPEHPLVDRLTTPECKAEVEAYKFKAARTSDIERLSTEKERDGVFIGAYAVNPMNQEKVPIFIADYVLLTYGTGAIQGVPAHDARDFAFARRYGLPIPVVVAPPGWDGSPLREAYLGEGTMVNSGPFSGLSSARGWEAVADYMEQHGIGKRTVHYRLHDWLISRQRYWGTPIPIIYCPQCGTVPVPDKDLPVTLPMDAEFLPTGESPLKRHEGFRRVRCPTCGGPAERETDTMDTFIDSSWYQYRYVSPHEAGRPFDPVRGAYWLPVDQYTGGVEHAVMHLLYTRFWTKVMRDLGLVSFSEPMLRLFNQGVILGEDGEKMSKSRGNVVNPDDYVRTMGADVVRTYLMFIGPWEGGGPWNSRGIEGAQRFLQRVMAVVGYGDASSSGGDAGRGSGPAAPRRPSAEAVRELRHWTHKTIKKVTEDLEGFRFNTAIAALMEFVNELGRVKRILEGTPAWREAVRTLVLLLAPIAPHLSEELWAHLGESYSVHQQRWPAFDAALARAETVTLVLQVNGRVRDRVRVPADLNEAEARELALRNERVRKFLDGKEAAAVVVVPGRLVNVVTR